MLRTLLSKAGRPATAGVKAARGSTRAISVSAIRRSDHPAPPSLFGEGAKAGEVPTDFQQATGLERLELLGDMEGIDVFDEAPLDSSRVGTLADPIKVLSFAPERQIGCTGSPAESHDVAWMTVVRNKTQRCPECGSAYALDYQGPEDHGHEAHH